MYRKSMSKKEGRTSRQLETTPPPAGGCVNTYICNFFRRALHPKYRAQVANFFTVSIPGIYSFNCYQKAGESEMPKGVELRLHFFEGSITLPISSRKSEFEYFKVNKINGYD
jgi:hypothetical protein